MEGTRRLVRPCYRQMQIIRPAISPIKNSRSVRSDLLSVMYPAIRARKGVAEAPDTDVCLIPRNIRANVYSPSRPRPKVSLNDRSALVPASSLAVVLKHGPT